MFNQTRGYVYRNVNKARDNAGANFLPESDKKWRKTFYLLKENVPKGNRAQGLWFNVPAAL